MEAAAAPPRSGGRTEPAARHRPLFARRGRRRSTALPFPLPPPPGIDSGPPPEICSEQSGSDGRVREADVQYKYVFLDVFGVTVDVCRRRRA